MPNSKKKKVVLFLAYLIIIYLIFEIIITASGILISPERIKMYTSFYEPDPELGYKIKPDLRNFEQTWLEDVSANYSTDELGFRNIGRDYNSSEYFFVGASFVFGSWVERNETFYGLFEDYVNKPVINLAVPGYDTTHYEILIRRYVPENDIKKTVFVSIPANDLKRPFPKEYFQNFYQNAGWSAYVEKGSFWDRFSKKRTLTYNLAINAYKLIINKDKEASNGLTLYRYRGANSDYIKNKYYIDIENEMMNLVDYAKSRKDIKLIILFLPSKESAYKEDYLELYDDKEYLLNEELGFKKLQLFFKKQSIPAYDMTNWFRENDEQQLYFKKDPHWNANGNLLAFQFLKEEVLNNTNPRSG